MCAGTYFIAIYCGYSLDFIIGYFKAFSNAIFNFDSYEVSIDFSDDNSKTFDDGGFNSFEDGVAELSIFSKTFIAQVNSYNSFIANYKVLSIAFINSISISFEDSVAYL